MARLVIDTFPRTGTAWLMTTAKLAFPNHEVVWGGHRRTNLKKEENVITTIRNPKDAVPSAMEMFGLEKESEVLDWYCRFTEQIIGSSNRIFIADFETLISDPNSIMTEYANRLSLTKPISIEHKSIFEETKKTHPENVPRTKTRARAALDQRVLQSPVLAKAHQLYQQALIIANEGIRT